MTFFLIVPSVMLVSIFLIHAIINRLGLRIHYVTLIMCAFLAVAADLGAIALTDVPNKFYFLRLGGFVFAAALATTATNYFLVKREREAEAEFSEQVRQAYQEKADEISEEEEIPEEVEEKVVEEVKPAEVKAEVKIEPKVELEKKIEPPKEISAEPTEKIEVPKKVEEVKPAEKVELKPPEKIEPSKPSEKIPEKVESKLDPEKKIEPPAKVELPKPAAKVENLPPLNIEVQGETLDDILDFAYSEKQQGHVWKAIAAYKKALEKYKNDEYAPFVAIDLGNIYKEQAFYTKAIKTYEEALELPAVRRNSSTRAEFKKNLIYLRTVQSVLLRHKALSTPFSKISRAYLQEIETEFQAMQLKFEE